ncbi:ComF family protein [Shimia sp. MMG029]|nr:ComF family protein [Shimia sp. MMG029]
MHSARNNHLAHKFQTALHLLFPPRCVGCGEMVESDFGLCPTCWADMVFLGDDVCDVCAAPVTRLAGEENVVCDTCLNTRPPWQRGRAALLYSGTGRQLILGLKHSDRTDVVRPAAKWLARVADPLLAANTLVAPVPLHRMRLLKRRYNQAALLADAFAKEVQAAYCPDILVRNRGSGSLEGLSAKERQEKLNGAIVPNPKRTDRLDGASVLLVDDVLTSGATLKSATEACFAANAKDVSVLVLARVAKLS